MREEVASVIYDSVKALNHGAPEHGYPDVADQCLQAADAAIAKVLELVPVWSVRDSDGDVTLFSTEDLAKRFAKVMWDDEDVYRTGINTDDQFFVDMEVT